MIWLFIFLACVGGNPFVMMGLFFVYVVFETMSRER